MGEHINTDGRFQSDKYPTCPPGKVPLSTRDPLAQDLLWEYAQRRRLVDAEFSEDLETSLKTDRYVPPPRLSIQIKGVNAKGDSAVETAARSLMEAIEIIRDRPGYSNWSLSLEVLPE